MNKLVKIGISLTCGLIIGWGSVAPSYAGVQHQNGTSQNVKVKAHQVEKSVRVAKVKPVTSKVRIVKMRTKGRIAAPLGLAIFCMKQSKYCHGGGAKQVAMSQNLMKILSRTNSAVNRAIRPRRDKGADVWSINVRAGDCEDYVLTKRAKLIMRGVPANSLRIATAYTRRGEGHAVLVVRTNKGDFVLDNRRNAIKEWHKTGLRWVSISGGNLRGWKKV